MFELTDIITLASTETEANRMKDAAERGGVHVKRTAVWDGPIPNGSFKPVPGMPWVSMSTPEYFFFRKTNQLPFAKAVLLGAELMSHFRTHLTSHTMLIGDLDYLPEPQTTYEHIRLYLWQVKSTNEGQRALAVLEKAHDVLDRFEDVMSTRLIDSLINE